jgi:hypothetical protein
MQLGFPVVEELFTMKRNYMLALVILIALVCSYSVWTLQKEANKDRFYEASGLDAMRVPLIKPYEMLKIDYEKPGWWSLGWSVMLHISPSEKEVYYYLNINDIKKIAVENRVIMIYSTDAKEVRIDAGQKILYWFVLIPDEKIETGFGTEVEFLSFVQGYGIQIPNWVEPDAAYEQFDKTGCLDWIPDCR